MTHSRTKGHQTDLFILTEYIGSHDRVLIIDDVMARGETAAALIRVADTLQSAPLEVKEPI